MGLFVYFKKKKKIKQSSEDKAKLEMESPERVNSISDHMLTVEPTLGTNEVQIDGENGLTESDESNENELYVTGNEEHNIEMATPQCPKISDNMSNESSEDDLEMYEKGKDIKTQGVTNEDDEDDLLYG